MAGDAPSLSAVDYLVFSASLIISLGIGLFEWYRNRGQDTRNFYIGGGNMAVLPVSISTTVGIVSAISMLGYPSEMYYYGSQLWLNVVGVMIGTAISVFLVIPVIYPMRLITIFESLEVRYGRTEVRKLTTVMHLLNEVVHMGIALYAPSLGIASVTPIPTNVSVVVLGLVCCVYASLGGAKAVVYTDTFQAVVMVAGVVVVVITGLHQVGGPANSWATDVEYGRIDFFNFSADPLERHTFMSTLLFGVYFALSKIGTGPPQYQRWASVGTLSQACLVAVLGGAGLMALWTLLDYSGLVVFSVYAECDPLAAGHIQETDQILMYYVADRLGTVPGVTGLFVAAVYSAVLSSVSSAINCISAMMWKDLLQPLSMFADTGEAKAKTIGIIISAVTGLVGVVIGLLAGALGSLVQAANTFGGALAGPATGIFFTAILCPWVNHWSAFFGGLCGLVLNLWVALGSLLYAPPPEMLYLSTDDCPSSNTTTTTTTDPFTLLPTTTTTTTDPNNEEVFPLYRLSYCFYGFVGLLTTFVMSTVISCFLGFADPSSVPVQAVNGTCFRFYCWLRGADMTLATSGVVDQRPPVEDEKSKPDEGKTQDSPQLKNQADLQVSKPQLEGCDNQALVEDTKM